MRDKLSGLYAKATLPEFSEQQVLANCTTQEAADDCRMLFAVMLNNEFNRATVKVCTAVNWEDYCLDDVYSRRDMDIPDDQRVRLQRIAENLASESPSAFFVTLMREHWRVLEFKPPGVGMKLGTFRMKFSIPGSQPKRSGTSYWWLNLSQDCRPSAQAVFHGLAEAGVDVGELTTIGHMRQFRDSQLSLNEETVSRMIMNSVRTMQTQLAEHRAAARTYKESQLAAKAAREDLRTVLESSGRDLRKGLLSCPDDEFDRLIQSQLARFNKYVNTEGDRQTRQAWLLYLQCTAEVATISMGVSAMRTQTSDMFSGGHHQEIMERVYPAFGCGPPVQLQKFLQEQNLELPGAGTYLLALPRNIDHDMVTHYGEYAVEVCNDPVKDRGLVNVRFLKTGQEMEILIGFGGGDSTDGEFRLHVLPQQMVDIMKRKLSLE